MTSFKFTSDKIVKRLRWAMLFAMLFDSSITLFSQPSSYWHHPQTVLEGNGFFRYFLAFGLPASVLTIAIYISVVFLLVSLLPRRLALVSIFSFILGHYFGASAWLDYYWHFGINGPIIYGIILGVVFVVLAFPTPDKTNAENLLWVLVPAGLICVLFVVFLARHHAQQAITGIGVLLSVRDETLEIESVLPDTPAAKAGLHPGLVIQEIDGTNIAGKPLAECVAMMRGPVGSKVQLAVIDRAKTETNIIEFTREKIPAPGAAIAP